MDVTEFTVDKLIIHEITERRRVPPTPSELVMSDVASPLDDDLKEYFQARIIEGVGRGAFPVVVDQDIEGSPTPELVVRYLTRPRTDFVAVSKELAQHLFEAQQKKASSPGLLVVISGNVDTGRCFAILKLKKQEGVRLERTGQRGAQTYSVEHLRQLMLTPDTRIFKAALFDSEQVAEPADLHGLVADKQRPYRPDKQVADFFLRDFLGCRVRDNPAQTTSTFFHSTERFINEKVVDPETQTRYHRALLTEMTSEVLMIDPRGFSRRYLAEADRGAYLDYLREETGSIAQFDKNPELIENRLREIEYTTQSNIRLRGPTAALDEHMDVSAAPDGVLEFVVKDRLKGVKGR